MKGTPSPLLSSTRAALENASMPRRCKKHAKGQRHRDNVYHLNG